MNSESSTPSSSAEDWQQTFLRDERLPATYLVTARRFFDPLAESLAADAARSPGALLVAVNGSQGSGKSTLCAYLVSALKERHGLRAATLSLDDFYLTRAERLELAQTVHPLLVTRGVPGTHDTALLKSTLQTLREGDRGKARVPAFDKSRDDRHPQAEWPQYSLPLDVVMLEGWCLGARSESEEELSVPLNALERDEDPDGVWRRYSNRCLWEHYEAIYALFQRWVFLAAPSFEQVFSWRSEQEAKLAERVEGRGEGLMDAPTLQRFVSHFERHTRHCLKALPARADIVFELDSARQIVACRGLKE